MVTVTFEPWYWRIGFSWCGPIGVLCIYPFPMVAINIQLTNGWEFSSAAAGREWYKALTEKYGGQKEASAGEYPGDHTGTP